MQLQMHQYKDTIDQAVSQINQAIGEGAAAFEQSVTVQRPLTRAFRADVLKPWDGTVSRLSLAIDPVLSVPVGSFAYTTESQLVASEA